MILKINNKYKPFLEILLVSVFAFFLHKTVFFLFDFHLIYATFYYSLLELYSFFTICSLVIIFILIKVKQADINNVGNAFLLLTLVKIAITFAFLSPLLASSSKYIHTEKMNSFMIFAVFLTIETVVTIRILNNKQ